MNVPPNPAKDPPAPSSTDTCPAETIPSQQGPAPAHPHGVEGLEEQDAGAPIHRPRQQGHWRSTHPTDRIRPVPRWFVGKDRMARICRGLLAVVAGVATGLGQIPGGQWLTVPGVAALTVLVCWGPARRAPLLGYLFGLGLYATTVSWASVLGWPVAVLLIAILGMFPALTAWTIRLVRDLPGAPVWAACMWSATEVLLARWPVGGFGWVRLAWSAMDTPAAGMLRWIGAVGVSLMVALAGQLLAFTILYRGRAHQIVDATILVLVLGLMCAVGTWTSTHPGAGHVATGATPAASTPSGTGRSGSAASAQLTDRAPSAKGQSGTTEPTRSVRVGIIQGGVDGTAGSHATGYASSVTANHLSETIAQVADDRAHGRPATDFLLWPENSTDIDPVQHPEVGRVITLASTIAHQPILVGAVTHGPHKGERQTTGMWWPTHAHAPTSVYHKRNLVPFGEWIPWRSTLLPLVPVLKQVGRQSVPGTTPGVIDARIIDEHVVVGDVICFELAYDPTVHDTVRNGAQLIAVQSNNATYTATRQPHQQWRMTRARAIELGRPIVVSTTSSLSGLITSTGEVVTQTTEGAHTHRSVSVPLTEGVSWGVVLTPWITWISVGVAVANVFVALMAAFLSGRRCRPKHKHHAPTRNQQSMS